MKRECFIYNSLNNHLIDDIYDILIQQLTFQSLALGLKIHHKLYITYIHLQGMWIKLAMQWCEFRTMVASTLYIFFSPVMDHVN